MVTITGGRKQSRSLHKGRQTHRPQAACCPRPLLGCLGAGLVRPCLLWGSRPAPGGDHEGLQAPQAGPPGPGSCRLISREGGREGQPFQHIPGYLSTSDTI